MRQLTDIVRESIFDISDEDILNNNQNIDICIKNNKITRNDVIEFSQFVMDCLSDDKKFLDKFRFNWYIDNDVWECDVYLDILKGKNSIHDFMFALGYRDGYFLSETDGSYNSKTKKYKTYIEPIMKNLPKLDEDINKASKTNPIIKKFKYGL